METKWSQNQGKYAGSGSPEFLLSWHLSLDICLRFGLNRCSAARFTVQFGAGRGFGTATEPLLPSSVTVCRGLVGDSLEHGITAYLHLDPLNLSAYFCNH